MARFLVGSTRLSAILYLCFRRFNATCPLQSTKRDSNDAGCHPFGSNTAGASFIETDPEAVSYCPRLPSRCAHKITTSVALNF